MEGLYTAKEARNKLGVTVDKFQYMVRTGQVKKVVLPGRKYGMYSRAEIDDIVARLKDPERRSKELADDEKHGKRLFRKASKSDVPEMLKLGAQFIWQNAEIPADEAVPQFEVLSSWMGNSYAEVAHVLTDGEHIIGFIIMLPLNHEQIVDLVVGEKKLPDIKPKELVPLEPGREIWFYIVSVVTDPTQRQIGATFIRKLLTFFHTLGKQGIEISGIYATAFSRKNRDLCHRFGMVEPVMLRKPSESLSSYRVPLMMTSEKRNRYTRNYCLALRNYKKRHSNHDFPGHRKDEVITDFNSLERYEVALAAFEQAIRLDPDNADAYFGKGAALKFLGRVDEARGAYKQAEHLRRKRERHETE